MTTTSTPWRISSLARPSNATVDEPLRLRIAWERPGKSRLLDQLALVEEDADLALGGGGGVGAVDDVLVDGSGQVAADRAGGGVLRVRGAHHLAPLGDGVLALHHHGDDGARGDERDESLEERLPGVLAVVALGQLAADAHELQRPDREALGLDAGDDRAGQAAAHAVRLDHGEGLFDCHGCGLYHGGGTRSGAVPGRRTAAVRPPGRAWASGGSLPAPAPRGDAAGRPPRTTRTGRAGPGG